MGLVESCLPQHDREPASNNYITLVADLAIVLFLYYVGLDLNEGLIRKQYKRAVPVAIAAIAVPFALGVGLGAWLFDINNSYLAIPVDRTAFYLFSGASMSFTALPVLASLLSATGLLVTPLGVQTMSSATVDDVLAWVMLAISSAFAKSDGAAGGVTFALAVAYLLIMFFVVRPVLVVVHRYYKERNNEGSHTLSLILIVTLLLSAFFCEIIQIHSFFGAFIAGLCAPKAGLWHVDMANKLEFVTKDLLLPLFFISSGSRTNITTIKGSTLIGAVFLVWLVATVGKFVPAFLTTRLVTGRSWRYSATVGVLMNTRGLVELIALNVGFTLGILSQPVFSVLVLMALLTTFCTTPLVYLLWINSSEGKAEMNEYQQSHAQHMEEVEFQRSMSAQGITPDEQEKRISLWKAERESKVQLMLQSGAPSQVVQQVQLVSPSSIQPSESDENRRYEQRELVRAMSGVTDAAMASAGDLQRVVFYDQQHSHERSLHSRSRGSVELDRLDTVVPASGLSGHTAAEDASPITRSGGSGIGRRARQAGGGLPQDRSEGLLTSTGPAAIGRQSIAMQAVRTPHPADIESTK